MPVLLRAKPGLCTGADAYDAVRLVQAAPVGRVSKHGNILGCATASGAGRAWAMLRDGRWRALLRAFDSFDFGALQHESNQALATHEIAESCKKSHTLSMRAAACCSTHVCMPERESGPMDAVRGYWRGS